MIALSDSFCEKSINHPDILIYPVEYITHTDENKIEELPPEIDIQHYVKLISQFNEAVNLQDYSLTNQCSDQLLQSLINDLPYSESDPICDDIVDLLFPFFCNCLKCLELGDESLFQKIVLILKNLSLLTTDVSSFIIEEGILNKFIEIFMKSKLPGSILTDVLKFFANIAIYSGDVREVFLESGILTFFISIIKSETDYQSIQAAVNCAHCFLRIDDFEELMPNPEFNEFLIHLALLLGKVLDPTIIQCTDQERTDLLLFILDIFDIFTSSKLHPIFADRTKTNNYLLNTPIPVYLSTLLESEIAVVLPQFALSITRIILQGLIFGEPCLAKEKSSEYNIELFAKCCFSESKEIARYCLSIIERLVYFHAENITILNSIGFYAQLIPCIHQADFEIQKRIIHILIAAIILDQSYTLLPILTFDCIDKMIDYVDVLDEYGDYKPQIFQALQIIHESLDPNHPEYEEIIEAVEEILM